MQKLEKQGYLSSTMKPSPDGPDRKYYEITLEGKEHCCEFIDQWNDITSNVNNLIGLKAGKFYK